MQKEFPEIKNVNDFATLINTIMTSPAEHKVLTGGREAFWDGKTVVIYNPNAGDKGTCFRPTAALDIEEFETRMGVSHEFALDLLRQIHAAIGLIPQGE